MDIVKINDLLIEVSSENTQLHLENERLENNWNELKEWLKKKIERNTPNVRWKHYNEDGFNDYDIENGNYISMQPVNVTFKEVIDKMQEIESGKNE